MTAFKWLEKHGFSVLWFGMFGWFIALAVKDHHWLFVAWCIFILGLVAEGALSLARRHKALKRFAENHGLNFLGGHLGEGFSLKGTLLGSRRPSVSEFMTGILHQSEVLIFDASYSAGKRKVRQTVIGFRREGPLTCSEAPVDRIGSYQFDITGDWLIGYIRGRVVAVEELEDWCSQLHDLARNLILDERGEGGASPLLFRWMEK